MSQLPEDLATWLQGIAAVASYDPLVTPTGFRQVISSIQVPGASTNGYAAVVYEHIETGAIIWAHRGTDGFTDIDDDIVLAGLIEGIPNQVETMRIMGNFLRDNAADLGIDLENIYHSGHSLGFALGTFAIAEYGGISNVGIAGAGVGHIEGITWPPGLDDKLTNYIHPRDAVPAGTGQMGTVVLTAGENGQEFLPIDAKALLLSWGPAVAIGKLLLLDGFGVEFHAADFNLSNLQDHLARRLQDAGNEGVYEFSIGVDEFGNPLMIRSFAPDFRTTSVTLYAEGTGESTRYYLQDIDGQSFYIKETTVHSFNPATNTGSYSIKQQRFRVEDVIAGTVEQPPEADTEIDISGSLNANSPEPLTIERVNGQAVPQSFDLGIAQGMILQNLVAAHVSSNEARFLEAVFLNNPEFEKILGGLSGSDGADFLAGSGGDDWIISRTDEFGRTLTTQLGFDPDTHKPFVRTAVKDGDLEIIKTEEDGRLLDTQILVDGIAVSFQEVTKIFGSTLGRQLGGDDAFGQVAAGAAIGTVAHNLGEIIDIAVFGDGKAVSSNISDALEDIPGELLQAGVGAVSSFLTAELIGELGLDGVAAGFANIVGGQAIDSIANGLVFGTDVRLFEGANAANAVSSFLGGKLAGAIVSPNSVEGQIGFSIGSSLGSLAGSKLLASSLSDVFGKTLGNFLAPGIGAFVGALAGSLVGSLLSGTPESGVHIYWDAEDGEFKTLADGATDPVTGQRNWDDDGASRELARGMAESARDILNGVVTALGEGGAELLNGNVVAGSAWGQHDNDGRVPEVRFWPEGENNPDSDYPKTQNIAEAIGGGVGHNLSQLAFVGGDLYARRALFANTANYAAGDPYDYEPATIFGDLAIAADYAAYRENAAVINLLLATNPQSAFSAGWAITLQRAHELGLDRYGEADLLGGLQSLLPFELPVGTNFADVSIAWADSDEDGASDDIVISIDGQSRTINIEDFATTMGFNEGSSSNFSDIRIHDGSNGVLFEDTNTEGPNGSPLERVGEAGNPTDRADDNYLSRTSDDIFVGGSGDDTLRGKYGWDWLDGGAGDDQIDGGDGKDVLLGRAGNDQLDGGRGDDTLADGAGADNIQGGDGDDKILVAQDSDADRFDGDDGSDTVSYADWTNGVTIDMETSAGRYGDTYVQIENVEGSHFADSIKGDSSGNILSGLGGDDTLDGYVGNDTLDGGAGADVLDGGAGVDTASYQSAASGVAASLATGGTGGDAAGDTYINIQNLQGSEHGDHLQGDGGSNSIAGGGGNDYLIASGGSDDFDGGDGFDIVDYSSANAGVVVNLQLGSTLSQPVTSPVSGGDPAPGDTGVVSVPEEVVYFNTFAGTDEGEGLSGDRFNDQIWGQGGNDTIAGFQGHDMLGGGAGHDRISAGSGHDIVFGGAGDDIISGGAGNDELYGGAGSDSLSGQSGDDTLYGGAGDDTLLGATGRDVIYGGDGADVVYANDDNDTVHGGAGDDTLNGGEDRDFLTGGAGNDKIFGGGDADTIFGDEGNDFLGGTDHDDLLYDGTGRDTVVGNTGDDTLKVSDDGEADFFRGGTASFDNGVDTASFDDWHRSVTINLSQTVNGYAIINGRDSLLGIENLILTGHADNVTGDSENNVIRGLGGEDTLKGHDGDDTIYGDEEADVIDGGAGDDLLHGGLVYGDRFEFVGAWGDDTIADFELGRDTLSFSGNFTQDDLIYEEVREDVDGDGTLETVHTRVRVDGLNASVLVRNVTRDQLRNNAATINDEDASTHSDADQLIVGGDEDDTIWARDGDDTVFGNDGNDIIGGGPGNDKLIGGNGSDVIFSAAGDDFADGGTGPDQVFGGDDEDTLLGGAGDDTVFGSAGNDVIHDGIGSDVLVGRGGNDKFVLENDGTQDKVHGENQGRPLSAGEEPGRDLVSYEEWDISVSVDLAIAHDPEVGQMGDVFFGIDDLLLTSQSDFGGGDYKSNQLFGGAGDDTLYGRDGNDTLDGGTGDDVLRGGLGDDLLIGGSGQSDTYVFDRNWGHDTIRGFNAEIDVIDLSASGLTPEDLVLTRVSGGTRLSDKSGNNSILLQSRVVEFADINFDFVEGEDRHTNVEGVIGSAYNDTLMASDAGSWLSGGRGNDALVGGQGDDSFVINLGDGVDTFEAKGGFDSIVIGEGAGFANLHLENVLNGAIHTTTLTIDASGSTKLVSTSGIYGGAIEQIVLSNGYAVNISGTNYTSGGVVLRGLDAIVNGDSAANRVVATGPDQASERGWLAGWGGNDTLQGDKFNDVLHGGTGNDRLVGGEGNDTYLYSIGDGHDVVIEASGLGDTLVFDEGITQEHLSYEWVGSGNNRSLRINVTPGGGQNGSVTINSWTEANGIGRIEWIYVDGVRLNLPREVHLDTSLENIAPVSTTDLVDVTINSSIIGAQAIGSVVGFDADGDPLRYHVNGNSDFWFEGSQLFTRINASTQQINVLSITVSDGRDSTQSDLAVVLTSADQADGDVQHTLPVVFDLDGDGVELISFYDSNVLFDMDNDGIRERSGWVGADDGLLVLDRNRNGLIDDASEISFVDDLAGANTDIEGLRAFDTNEDGKLTADDDSYYRFQIWRDVNSDGISQTSELFKLEDLGITEISLDIQAAGQLLEGRVDNAITGTVNYTTADGSVGEAADVSFVHDGGNGLIVRPVAETLNAELVGGSGPDTLLGGLGHDTLHGGGGADRLLGGQGNDQLEGDVHDDTLEGNLGDDTLRGNDGADVLSGGSGTDRLTGGSGGDVFSFVRGWGSDTITDFTVGADTIDIGPAGLRFEDITLTQVGANTEISDGEGNVIILENVTATSISQSDFEVEEVEYIPQGDQIVRLDTSIAPVPGFVSSEDGLSYVFRGNGVFGGIPTEHSVSSGKWYWEQTVDENYHTDVGLIAPVTTDWTASEYSVARQLNVHFYERNGRVYRGSGSDADYIRSGGIVPPLGGTIGVAYDADAGKLWISVNGVWLFGATDADVAAGLKATIENIAPGTYVPFAGRFTGDVYSTFNFGSSDFTGSVPVGFEAYNNADTEFTPAQFVGTSRDDDIVGTDGAEVVSGNEGDDTLEGGAGSDTLDGGSGVDTASYASSSQAVQVDLLAASASGGDAEGDMLTNIEIVQGSDHNDTIAGSSGADTIEGGHGSDHLLGHDGNDYLQGGTGADSIEGGAGDDTLQTGHGADLLLGGEGDDALSAGSGDDTLEGGEGDDTLLGHGGGTDVFDGGSGIDRLSYEQAAAGVVIDLNQGTAGGFAAGHTYVDIEQFAGSGHADTLAGGSSSEALLGGAGDDWLVASLGADTLDGGDGSDRVDYIHSNGAISLNLTTGVNSGGYAEGDVVSNVERVHGSAFNDLIIGDHRATALSGGAGDDTLAGEGGDDQLYGNEGHDALDGGAGNDTLEGGTGNDQFVFRGNWGSDIVTDFAQGTDVIDLSGTALQFEDLAITQVGADTHIADGNGNTITLQNVTAANLGESDFTFVNLIRGTDGDDSINGTNAAERIEGLKGADWLDGGAGADTIDGGEGHDRAIYSASTAPVSINLSTGINTGGYAEGDVLLNIEELYATNFDDTIVGSDAGEILIALDGDDIVFGAGGRDTLYAGAGGADSYDGGEGHDQLVYGSDDSAITINLTTGVHGGSAANDTIANIEEIYATHSNDFLVGDANANTFIDRGGNDTIEGAGGNDTFFSGNGADVYVFNAGDGSDYLNLFTSGEDKLDFTGTNLQFADLAIEQIGAHTRIGYGADSVTLVNFTSTDLTSEDFTFINLIRGTDSDDSINGTNAAERIEGLQGRDTILGFDGNDTLKGGDGNDALYGELGADLLLGEDGHDWFEGGLGADTIDGGAGWNTLYYGASTAAVHINTNTGIHTGGDAEGDVLVNISTIFGGGLDDTFIGGDATDDFRGGAGDDTLDGGAGDDSLTGSLGNDTFVFGVNWGVDTVTDFTQGEDVLDLTASGLQFADLAITQVGADTHIADGNGNTITLQNFSATNLTASDFVFANVIEGTSGNDSIQATMSHTIIDALGGDDRIYAGLGVDKVDGGDGYDFIDYTFAPVGVRIDLTTGIHTGFAEGDTYINIERLNGSNHNDTIVGGGGVRTLAGLGGDDVLTGTTANEVFNGGLGNDLVEGGGGHDDLYDDRGSDTLRGGVGDDRLFEGLDGTPQADAFDGGDGVDAIYYNNAPTGLSVNLATGATSGSAAGDTYVDLEHFYGTNHNDVIVGGAGFTLLHGRDGDDSLSATDANETLTGGVGNDSFIFGVNWGSDIVTDFTKGEDTLDLSATGLQFEGLTIMQAGADTVIDGGNGNQITLQNFTATNLNETDFTFANAPVQTAIGPRSLTLDETIAASNHYTWSENDLSYHFTSSGSGAVGGRPAQAGVSSGKWYWEQTLDHTTSGNTRLGLIAPDTTLWDASGGYHVIRQQDVFSFQVNGNVYHGDLILSGSNTEHSFGRDDVIGVAFDADAGKLWISINGEWLNGATETDIENGLNATISDIPEGVYLPFAAGNRSDTVREHAVTFNFGATDFASSPPAGFSEYGHADPEFGVEITGSVSDNLINGTGFDDVISGGRGNDTINGLEGPDTIDGGEGDDLITTGAGSDVLKFAANWGTDTVTDYEVGVDRIDLTGTDLRFSELTITQAGADTLIEDIFGNSITLTGATASNITEADFIFRDTASPTITIDKLVTTDITPVVTGTIDNPFATVEVTIGGTTYDAINNGDGTWTAEVTDALPDGEYGVTVRSVDRHGVVGIAAPTLSFAQLAGVDSSVHGIDIGNDSAPRLVDFDNDGDLDLIAGERTGAIVYYENTGSALSPIFTARTGADNPFDGIDVGEQATPDIVDIDNDGDLDAFFGSKDTGIHFYENIGTSGSPDYVERTGSDNPLSQISDQYTNLKFADFDNDGDQDVFVTHNILSGSSTLIGGYVVYYENIGSADTPNFIEVSEQKFTYNQNIAPEVVDINQDGYLDILFSDDHAGYGNGGPGAINYRVFDPTGPFQFVTDGTSPFHGLAPGINSSLTLGDLNSDGYFDAIVGRNEGQFTYFEGTASDNPDVHIDLTAPTVAITTPAHWFQRDVPRRVDGTVDDPDAEIVLNLAGQIFEVNNHGNGTWRVDLPVAVGAGAITIEVSATDSVGNVGTGTLQFDIEPIVTIDALTTSDTTPMITGTIDAPGAEISIEVNGQTIEGVNNSDGTWFAELPADGPALTDGYYAVTYSLTLASGTTYQGGDVAASGEHSLTVDTAGTAITLDATQSTYPVVTGTVGDAETTVEVMMGGETVAATNNGDGTWSADLSGMLVSGSHVVTVNATDPQGNVSSVNQSYDIAPLVSFNGVTTRDNTPTLTGTVDDPTATVTVEVDGNSYAAVNNGDGTWAADVTTPIADGYHAAVVTAIDANGLTTTQTFTSEHVSFTHVTGDDNPFDGINANFYKSVTFMDIDSDGDLDAVAVTSVTESSAEQIKYFENTGNANAAEFVEQTGSSNPFDLLSSENLAGNAKIVLSDVDGDGDLDMVLSTARELYYYQNTGDASAPNFVKQTGAADPFDGISTNRYYQGVYFADIDGDGDEDFVTSWGSGGVQFYENTSSGGNIAFTHRTDPADNPFSNLSADHFTIVDVDLDGDLDFVNSNLSYYENIGSKTDAQFVSRAGADNPFDGSPTQSNGARYHALVDLDNDGDLDTFLASYSQTSSPIQRNGYLSESTPVAIHIDSTAPDVAFDAIDRLETSFPRVSGTIDDAEAAVEVVVAGQTFTGVNNGDGTWSAEISGVVVTSAHDIEVRAIDTFGNVGTNSLTSDFAPVVTLQTISTQDTTPTLTGAIDDPNATIEVTVGGNTYIGTNHGDGTWEATVTDALAEGDYSVSVKATDAAGRVGYNDRELLGYSEVTGADNPFDGFGTGLYSSPELGDLDGDLDLVVGSRVDPARYFENTGTSEAPVFIERTGGDNPFSSVGFVSNEEYFSPTLVDIDSDGDLDAFFARNRSGPIFLRNDGSSASPQFNLVTGSDHPFDGMPDWLWYAHSAFTDLDDDGDLDAILGRDNGYTYYFRNDGSATNPDFTFVTDSSETPWAHSSTTAVAGHAKPEFFDLDGDGDQDLIIGSNSSSHGPRFFENQGTVNNPSFQPYSGNPDNLPDSWLFTRTAPTFANLSGDNVTEIIVGEYSGSIHYYQANSVELTIEPGGATSSAKVAFAPPPTSAAMAAVAVEEAAPTEVSITNAPNVLPSEVDIASISEDQLREAWLHLREENAGAAPSREQLASMLSDLTGPSVAAKQDQGELSSTGQGVAAELPIDTPRYDIPEFESGMDESFLMSGMTVADNDDATVQTLTQAAEQAQADMAGLLGSAEMLQSPTLEDGSGLTGLDVDAGQFDLVAANDQSLLALTQAMATFDNGAAAMETDARRRLEREETIGSLFAAGGSL